jgi:transcriptional regulator with XRE-family HTH domain
MYGIKIRMVRELRGLSQENVAARLGIAQNTYSKYENNQSKISAEMLENIAKVLEVSPMDLLSQQPAIVNFQPNQGTQQSIGHVDTVINNQKELYEQMLASKDEEIARMQRIIDSLLDKK